jgi:hypothetical protein
MAKIAKTTKPAKPQTPPADSDSDAPKRRSRAKVSDTIRRQAYILYATGLKMEQIKEILHVNKNTLTEWREQDAWDAQIDSEKFGPEQIMRRLQVMHNEVLETIEAREKPHNVPTAQESIVILRLSTSVAKLMGEIHQGIRMQVGKEFITYLTRNAAQTEYIRVSDLWHAYLMSKEEKTNDKKNK